MLKFLKLCFGTDSAMFRTVLFVPISIIGVAALCGLVFRSVVAIASVTSTYAVLVSTLIYQAGQYYYTNRDKEEQEKNESK